MNKLFVKLLSQLSDGIVMFDITGKVLFSNLKKLGLEGIVVDKRIAVNSIMKEVAEIDSSKETNIKEIKLTMVEQLNNDNYTVIFQNEKLFCLYIRNELEREKYKTLQDNMFALINHELRTPMQTFTGEAFLLSEMLKESKGKIENTKDFHSLIKSTIDSVTEVTSKMEKLLELSETYGSDPMNNKERINIIEVADSAIYSLKEMSSNKNIVIKIEKKGEIIGNLYGSFGWLKRAIEECVLNSIEHSQRGSEIHLQVRQNSNFAHVTIRDFGRGIAPKIKGTLFEAFRSGGDKNVYSNQGLGIGLSLAKKIIDNHGGNIKNVGIKDGAEFHIELPTGGVSTSSDLDIRQSQLYARDMAMLMKRMK